MLMEVWISVDTEFSAQPLRRKKLSSFLSAVYCLMPAGFFAPYLMLCVWDVQNALFL